MVTTCHLHWQQLLHRIAMLSAGLPAPFKRTPLIERSTFSTSELSLTMIGWRAQNMHHGQQTSTITSTSTGARRVSRDVDILRVALELTKLYVGFGCRNTWDTRMKLLPRSQVRFEHEIDSLELEPQGTNTRMYAAPKGTCIIISRARTCCGLKIFSIVTVLLWQPLIPTRERSGIALLDVGGWDLSLQCFGITKKGRKGEKGQSPLISFRTVEIQF